MLRNIKIHISEIVRVIQLILIETKLNEISEISLFNENEKHRENRLFSLLTNNMKIKVSSKEFNELLKEKNKFIENSKFIKIENNKVKFSVNKEFFEYLSTKNTLKTNFISYNNKSIFKEFVEKSENNFNESSKIQNLLFSKKENSFSYNLLRNLKFLDKLQTLLVESETDKKNKELLKTVILLNNEVLNIKVNTNKQVERNNFVTEYEKIYSENKIEIDKLKNLSLLEQIDFQVSQNLKVENFVEMFEQINLQLQ